MEPQAYPQAPDLTQALAEAQRTLDMMVRLEEQAFERYTLMRDLATEMDTQKAQSIYVNASIEQAGILNGIRRERSKQEAHVLQIREQIENSGLRQFIDCRTADVIPFPASWPALA